MKVWGFFILDDIYYKKQYIMKFRFNEDNEDNEEFSNLELTTGHNEPEKRESRTRKNFKNKATQWTNDVLSTLKRMHRLTDRTNYIGEESEFKQIISAIKKEVKSLDATFKNGKQIGFSLKEDYDMKIKKNGKVIRLTESDLKKIVKRVLTESDAGNFYINGMGPFEYHRDDYYDTPVYNIQYFEDPDGDSHIPEEFFDPIMKIVNDSPHMSEFMEMGNEMIVVELKDEVDDFESLFKVDGEVNILPKPSRFEKMSRVKQAPQVARMVKTGEELYRHILNKYIGPIMDEKNMDDFGDPFAYYDNVIGWGIEKYLETEEPEREDDWDYRDELEEEIKDWWMPI